MAHDSLVCDNREKRKWFTDANDDNATATLYNSELLCLDLGCKYFFSALWLSVSRSLTLAHTIPMLQWMFRLQREDSSVLIENNNNRTQTHRSEEQNWNWKRLLSIGKLSVACAPYIYRYPYTTYEYANYPKCIWLNTERESENGWRWEKMWMYECII